MKLKKEVKHSVVYETADEDAPCKSVYVSREWLKHTTGSGAIPQAIELEVRVAS